MGSNSSREGRGSAETSAAPASPSDGAPASHTSQSGRPSRPPHGSSYRRSNRHDLSILGIGTSSSADIPERRETKQEREKRKLEKERVAREKERELSLKEEHVDGGYLVTMGVYTGTEDFNKAIVRQLMLERRIAPFWRGLDDFKSDWTEHQLIAAARGLPIPAPDEIPPPELQNSQQVSISSSAFHPTPSQLPQVQGATLPLQSSPSATTMSAHGFATPSPTPFRQRTKPLAALSRNSSSELVPREISLPQDPYVNRQALEVYLYKDADDCPICFLSYPPYLNLTRCCGQPICSECFVQIKRPDPHPPEHTDPSSPAPPPETAAEAEMLVSEPATCPYCAVPEFGVTYDPPPFRRGLAYAKNGTEPYSSTTAPGSSLAVEGATTARSGRRRTTSMSANSPAVVTTDRVRPEWSTKLANARNHLARRSAAATALHTAAYLIGDGSGPRGFVLGGRSRFGRSRGDDGNEPAALSPGGESGSDAAQAPVDGRTVLRRSRVEDLEEMMMMEAIRQSIAAEEERTRKAEKEAAKEAKKRAKEEKKQEKVQEKRERRERKSVYGGGSTSASGSALSLVLPGIGRRRNNSGGSSMSREITAESPEGYTGKGKAVDRARGAATAGTPRPLDTQTASTYDSAHMTASPTAPDRPSHLRSVSNASNVSSHDSQPEASELSRLAIQEGSEPASDVRETQAGTSQANDHVELEPLFNYSSLAHMIGNEDGEEAERLIEYPLNATIETAEDTNAISNSHSSTSAAAAESQHDQEGGQATQPLHHDRMVATPEVMITPVSPVLQQGG